MGIVCRPILLYNEFLPAKTGDRKWDYHLLGHYDGMELGEPFEKSHCDSFHEMFNISVEVGGESEYFTQTLFGLFTEREREKEFWKSELPFTFLVLLQFQEKDIRTYKEYLESENFLEDEKGKLGMDDANEIHTFVYYSFDNSDLILVLKCSKYIAGAKIINNLHQDIGDKHRFSIINTYSILAFREIDIKNIKNFVGGEEKIDLLELRIVERFPNSAEDLFIYLKNKLGTNKVHRKAVLGSDDEIIIINNILWKEILEDYQLVKGVLNNANERAQQYANAISTKLMLPIYDENYFEKKRKCKKNEDKNKLLCDYLMKKIETGYQEKNTGRDLAEKKTLMMIANSLCRFEKLYYEKSGFSDYNFFPIILPFYMFVDFLIGNNGEESITTYVHDRDYFEFVKGLNLRTQNFVKPDRVYSQVADFNVRYFDVPAKFMVFYSAYSYYFKKHLNGLEEKKYEFMICPGISHKVVVKELFARERINKRLFLVEVPEQQIYQVKSMLIILGHEIAHFVGSNHRERENREKQIISMSSKAVSLGLIGYIKKFQVFPRLDFRDEDLHEECKKMETMLEKWLTFYLERNRNPAFLEKKFKLLGESINNNYKYYETYGNHSDVLGKELENAFEDMMRNQGMQLLRWMIPREFEKECDSREYENMEDFFEQKEIQLQKCIDEVIGRKMESNVTFTIGEAIRYFFYFLKECYADMMCVLVLKLSLKDYIETFVENIKDSAYDINELGDTEIIARIALVMFAISYWEPEDEDLETRNFYHWTNEEFCGSQEWDEEVRILKERALQFQYVYIGQHVDVSQGNDIEENALNIIYDSEILMAIIKYLLRCRRSYYKYAQNDEYYEMVKRCYQIAAFDDVDKVFCHLMKVTTDYENAVFDDMQKILKEKDTKGD